MTDVKNIVASLNDLFQAGEEDVIVIDNEAAQKCKDKGCKAVVFDFDGVLLKEIGLAEKGYAWVVRAVRDGIVDPGDFAVADDDVKAASDFRPNIKGKSMVEKVAAFRENFGKVVVEVSDEEFIQRWFDALKNIVASRFNGNKDDYCLPGAQELVHEASLRSKVMGVTANEHNHASWLMDFVGLKKYFEEIVGYPIRSLPRTSKASLLADLLFRREINPAEACYIGDAVSDIKAGKRAGTVTIGIANNETAISKIGDEGERQRVIEKSLKNAEKLVDAGCDLLATSSMAYKEIARYFRQLHLWKATEELLFNNLNNVEVIMTMTDNEKQRYSDNSAPIIKPAKWSSTNPTLPIPTAKDNWVRVETFEIEPETLAQVVAQQACAYFGIDSAHFVNVKAEWFDDGSGINEIIATVDGRMINYDYRTIKDQIIPLLAKNMFGSTSLPFEVLNYEQDEKQLYAEDDAFNLIVAIQDKLPDAGDFQQSWLLGMLRYPDVNIRCNAIVKLEDCGTESSLPLLTDFIQKNSDREGDRDVRLAQRAFETIAKRTAA